MNLRIATTKDFQKLSELCTPCMIYEIERQGFNFDVKIFHKNLFDLILAGTVLAVEEDGQIVGGVGGRLVTSIFGQDVLYDIILLYIDPDYRYLTSWLMGAIKAIMDKTTVTKIIISNPAFDCYAQRERFYKMKGYSLLQSSMLMNIKSGVSHAS